MRVRSDLAGWPPVLTGALVIAGAIILLIIFSPARNPGQSTAPVGSSDWVTLSCQHMATTISVIVPDTNRAPTAGRILSNTFGEVDRQMSEWKEGSPLAEVNRMAGRSPVVVPRPLLELIERSLALAEITGGAFDPTWAALWGVWDFRAESPTLPDTDTIQRAASLVDYSRLRIDRDASTVLLPQAGMKIGLGGIAKGYAIDLAATRLRDAGFTQFMIVAGGQVYAHATKGTRLWRVGIRDPRGAPDDLFATVDVHDASVSTSGDYERFFEIGGVRYHHILDPRTGRPARSPRSVTVISHDATLADAVSTALMIVDHDQRERILAETGIEWALFVEQDGRVREFGNARPDVTMLHDPHPE